MSSSDFRYKADSYAEALRQMTQRYEGVVQSLSILRQMDELDDPELDIDQICRRAVETIAFGMAVENCSLMLMDSAGEFLELRAACSPLENGGKSFSSGEWPGKRFRLGEGIVGKVAETGQVIRSDDVTRDENFVPAANGATTVHSLMTFPLREGEKTLGVINLSHSKPAFFSLESENTLALVAERAARILSRHLLYQRLRESEAHYRLVTENASDGMLVFDSRGRIVSANPAVEQITGIPPERYIRGEADWESAIHPDDRQKFTIHRTDLVNSRASSTVEYRCLDTHGDVHYLEEHSSPILDPAGKVTGIVSVVRDASERKRAEEERRNLEARIQHAQKLESLGVLAGGIAHDFNNLLTGIMGNADLVLIGLPSASPMRERIESVEKAAERAADLAKQMLAYSGKGKFLVEPIDLSKLVEDMARLLKVSISKRVALKRNLAPNLPAIEADATQIRQVVMNLITNASEALGGTSVVVTISTGVMQCDRAYLEGTYLYEGLPEGPYVYLEVADTGCGMDKETLEKIFDPFFTTKFTGRGLGLAGVLGIVRGHHGALKVDSAPGRGTTFKVLFPCSSKTAAQAQEQDTAAKVWRGGGTLLIVDGEEIVRIIGKRMLEEFGFTVLTASNGRQGVELLREHADEIAAVILDLNMPHMSGEETFSQMRRIKSDARVILSSGYGEQESTEPFTGKGLAGFIQKPYRAAKLMEKLREVLGP